MAAGGPDTPDNLIVVCSNCHSKITAGDISEAADPEVKTMRYQLIYVNIEREPGAKQSCIDYRSLESCHVSADECGPLLESHESLSERLVAFMGGVVEAVVGGPFSGGLPDSLDRVELG